MKDTKERYAHKRWPLIAIVVFVGFSIALKPDASYKGRQITSIMLDAGHGGSDPGNLGTGRYSETEKDITLKVTRLLGKYIEDNIPDVEVLYTRKGDSYPELHERTKMANRWLWKLCHGYCQVGCQSENGAERECGHAQRGQL